MYIQVASVPIKSSASLIYNNFDVLPGKNEGDTLFGVIHKSILVVFNPQAASDGDATTYKWVKCKGESSHSSTLIMQAKWCVFPMRTVLVAASIKGIQMFEPDGSVMIFWQALPPNSVEGLAQYARGITAVGTKNICVGAADGSILVFDVPIKGTGIKLQETLSSHECSITDLHAFQDTLVSADESGKIILWKVTGHVEKLRTIKGYGSPCSSVRMWKTFILAGYGSGHLRVFHVDTGVIIAEIAAHARWINAIDIAEACGLLVTCSEDSYIRIWNLYNFELLYQQSLCDIQLTGARFLDPNGKAIGVTGYDSPDVMIFQKV